MRGRLTLLAVIIIIFLVLFSLMLYSMEYALRTISVKCSGPLCGFYNSARGMVKGVFGLIAVGMALAFIISFIVLALEASCWDF